MSLESETPHANPGRCGAVREPSARPERLEIKHLRSDLWWHVRCSTSAVAMI